MKFIHYGLTPFMAVLLVVVKLPFFVSEIEGKWKYGWLTVAIVLFAGTAYTYYANVISPYSSLRKIKERRWDELNTAALKISEQFIQYDINITFNIMIPLRSLVVMKRRDTPRKVLYFFNSKISISFFQRFLKPIWRHGPNHIHSKLKFALNQGSCGKAFLDEKFYFYDIDQLKKTGTDFKKEFNFTAEQIRLTSDVTAVASLPVISVKKHDDGQKYKIIGVINVDSTTETASKFFANPGMRDSIQDNMTSLMKLYLASHV